MPFIPRPYCRALVFPRYSITPGDYRSIASAAGNFPKIKIGARGTCDPTFIRESVTGAAGDCSFSLLVSNFDTFSAQFFALARGGYTPARIGFSGSEVQSACSDSNSHARARAPTTGLSAIYFFIIVVVVYRAIAIPELSRLWINEPADSAYTVIPWVQETLISHLYTYVSSVRSGLRHTRGTLWIFQ